MGRRTGRSASVALLAVVVLLSIFAGHAPDRHAAASAGGLSTPGMPSVNLKPDLGTRGRGPDSSPSPDSSAVPEYPSSVVPQPMAQSGGPRILMDNAISAHHFDDAWA